MTKDTSKGTKSHGQQKTEGSDRKLKVLELFSGTRSIGRAFEERGHEVYSVEWDERF